MAQKKHLDHDGLLYLWTKLKNLFVAKVDGKDLSTNDYTNDEKEKLKDIEPEANKTTIVNSLESDSTTDALSAAQGKELKAKFDSINDNLENLGAGDMLKSVYDTDGNGSVNMADRARDADFASEAQHAEDATEAGNAYKLGGVEASKYAQKGTTLSHYGISDAYTKLQVDSAIANAGHLKREIVTSVPTASTAKENVIYMLKVTSATGADKYKEYMLINGEVVQTGDTSVDLSDYILEDDLVAITNAEIDATLAT